METPNREPQEYSRNIIENHHQGPHLLVYSYYILRVPSLGFPLKGLYSFPDLYEVDAQVASAMSRELLALPLVGRVF